MCTNNYMYLLNLLYYITFLNTDLTAQSVPIANAVHESNLPTDVLVRPVRIPLRFPVKSTVIVATVHDRVSGTDDVKCDRQNWSTPKSVSPANQYDRSLCPIDMHPNPNFHCYQKKKYKHKYRYISARHSLTAQHPHHETRPDDGGQHSGR